MRLLKKRIEPKVHTPEMEIVMSTLHRVREFALAAVLVAQAVSFAPLSSAAEAVTDLGAMTVFTAREARLADLGSMTVSATRIDARVADLGALTVTARRDAGFVVAQARSGVASEAPRVHSWN